MIILNFLHGLYAYVASFFRKPYLSPYVILERFNGIRNQYRANQQINLISSSNRVDLIREILFEHNIEYKTDVFSPDGSNLRMTNIIVDFNDSSSEQTVIHDVHHDVVNIGSMNVLDNTASVANLLALCIQLKGKRLITRTIIAFVDGEECGGYGARRIAEQINQGLYGNVVGVISHELTGSGKMWADDLNDDFLGNKLLEIDSEMKFHWTPPNDVTVYRGKGIPAVCLGIIPDEQMQMLIKEEYCNYWSKCHTDNDDMGYANEQDMKKYVMQLQHFSL